jgi:hypothetical protein
VSEAERELEAIRAKMARGELDPERVMDVAIRVTRFNVGPLVSKVVLQTGAFIDAHFWFIVAGAAAVALGVSNLLPDGVETKGTFIDGAGNGAGGRSGMGRDAGTFGWGGAAGTVGFVNVRMGLRAGIYTQYMPSEALPVHAEFPQTVLADLAAMRGA